MPSRSKCQTGRTGSTTKRAPKKRLTSIAHRRLLQIRAIRKELAAAKASGSNLYRKLNHQLNLNGELKSKLGFLSARGVSLNDSLLGHEESFLGIFLNLEDVRDWVREKGI